MDARTAEIWKLTEPLAQESGCELAEVEFAGAGARQILRIYLDRPGAEKGCGVTVDHCVEVSRKLGDVLDAYETIRGGYMLEVSTPGFERPLRRAAHYRRYVGETVKLRLRGMRDGRRSFTGRLIEVSGEADGPAVDAGLEGDVEIAIEGASAPIRFRLDEIEKAQLAEPPRQPQGGKGDKRSKGRRKKAPAPATES